MGAFFQTVASRLASEQTAALDALSLVRPAAAATTGFQPDEAKRQGPRRLIRRCVRLDGPFELASCPSRYRAASSRTWLTPNSASSRPKAAVLEVGDMLRISEPGKRDTLLLALIRQSMMRCRDELTEDDAAPDTEDPGRGQGRSERATKNQHRGIEEGLIGVLHQVAAHRHGGTDRREFWPRGA